jgi:hypothetical protein
MLSFPSTARRTCVALCATLLLGTASVAWSQEDNSAQPTMQDVLQSLENENPIYQAPQQAPAAPHIEWNDHTTPSDIPAREPSVLPQGSINEQAPPPAEAPVIENINPALAPTTEAPQAPTAERAETPPAPPKPLVFSAQKYAQLQTLDKVTARTDTLTVAVGETIAVGPLFMQVKTCQRSAPYEQPESAAFLQVWEATPKDVLATAKDKNPSQWVFSGWMFASSPALSAMDHPIYDIWVLSCKNNNTDSAAKSDAAKEKADAGKESEAKTDKAESKTAE